MPLSRVPPANSTIRPYPLARMVLATATLIVVLIGATAAVLLVSYRDTLRQEMTNLRNLSIAFAAQTFSVAQGVDNVMLQAERAYARRPAMRRTRC